MCEYEALYSIVKWLLKDMYKLELSTEIKIHLTFHVLLFKQIKEKNIVVITNKWLEPLFDLLKNHFKYEVQGIIEWNKPNWKKLRTWSSSKYTMKNKPYKYQQEP